MYLVRRAGPEYSVFNCICIQNVRNRVFQIIYMHIKSVGQITDPCGTPQGQLAIDDKIPFRFTCWVLLERKLLIYSHRDLLMFIRASFSSKILWFTIPKALQKSKKQHEHLFCQKGNCLWRHTIFE